VTSTEGRGPGVGQSVREHKRRQYGLARSLLADPRFGPLPGLLLILTAVTGVVDAAPRSQTELAPHLGRGRRDEL
jgi:hypothetical protein